MSDRTVAVIVFGSPGIPVAGAAVTLDDRPIPHIGMTNGDGYVAFPVSDSVTATHLWVDAKGYREYNTHVDLIPGNCDLIVGQASTPLAPHQIQLAPLVASAPDRVTIQNGHFVSKDRRWVWKMMTGFLDYQKFLAGDDIRPLLDETRELGGNGRRVLGMVNSFSHFWPQEHPEYIDRLPEFLALNAQHGLWVEFVVFADAQYIIKDVFQQRHHFNTLCERLREVPNVFVELCNEWPKNGVAPTNHSKPTGVVSSQGSKLSDEAPLQPGWDYQTFHGRRGWPKVLLSSCDPAFCLSRGIDANGKPLSGGPKPFIHNEPIGFAEVDITSKRSTNPQLAEVLGADAALHGDGATFHCDGGLRSVPLGPVQRVCASAFYAAT